jgi:DNA-directed RNA polymerase subunit beta
MTTLEKENEQLTEALSNILLGEKLQFEIVNSRTGEIIIPAHRRITKTLLRRLAAANPDGFRLRWVSP